MRGIPTWISSLSGGAPPGDPGAVTALLWLWSRDEPDRVGEICPVPGGFPEVSVRLGRQEATPSTAASRVEWMRQRPGHNTPTGPFRSLRVSRDQLRLFTDPSRALHVQNVGRCPLLLNHRPCEEAPLKIGDLLELRDQALLLCVHRDPLPPDDLLPAPPFGAPDPLGLCGESPATWSLRAHIHRAAFLTSNVLLCGQSGAGQEQVAHAIHALSPRNQRPLVARSVATLSRGLIDAALFGNARNYPHAGMREHVGLLGEARGSTLSLDSFAQLSAPLQERLLTALRDRRYCRLGEPDPRPTDVRLIASVRPSCTLPAATLPHLPLRIDLPDLNQRREDLPHLIRSTLQHIAGDDPQLRQRCFLGGDPAAAPFVTARLVACLAQRRWTTHLRELEGILWRCANEGRPNAPLDTYEGLTPDLPPASAEGRPDRPSVPPDPSLRPRRPRGAARGS